SVRSRLYLENLIGDNDREAGAGKLRVLSVKKANYAEDGQRIILEWHDGRYRPQTTASTIERAAADAEADSVFMKLLDRLEAQNRDVSASPSRIYAPALMAKFEEGKAFRRGVLDASMNRLLDAGKIKVINVGPPSRGRK